MNPLATSKEDILAASKELIQENGWTSVSIRAVASKCSVSPGTIYNYFDSKAELVGATIESIWHEIFSHIDNKEIFRDFAKCIVWIYDGLEAGNEKYPGFFSLHSIGFIGDEKISGKEQMLKIWEHILKGLCLVLKSDPKIRRDVFDLEFTEKDFAEVVFSQILVGVIRKDYNPLPILRLIKRTLY